MSLVLQSSGGGQITIQEPATASNFTQTLPAATGTVALLDGSNNLSVAGNLSFNSGYGSSAVAYGCRAWVNFNGTGIVAIRASGNVSSITDNGVGNYTVNFTNAMPDANYSIQICSSAAVTNDGGFNRIAELLSSSARILHYENNSLVDTDQMSVAVFR
jgi:hypothetical protein